MTDRYVMLAVLWSGWCALHSILASLPLHHWLREHAVKAYRYYRLFYNGFALLTLAPVLLYSYQLQGAPFFIWEGPLRLLQATMIGGGLVLFLAPLRHYDMGQFLGLRQLRKGTALAGLDEGGGLNTAGILGWCRHPWYSGGLLLIWARDLDMATLIVNAVLSAYLIIGAHLEERKLLREFGEAYRRYQHAVPMFIPWKKRGAG
ncbi:MAG: methyltransferase family protein [Gammaproteobacteria bacterium]